MIDNQLIIAAIYQELLLLKQISLNEDQLEQGK